MTDISEIVRLSQALTNQDRGSLTVPAGATIVRSGSRERAKSSVSQIVEYAVIATYVAFAGALLVPPYLATMSHFLTNLLPR